jgi:tRNA (uracil-5-)-methyltransferase TRM9
MNKKKATRLSDMTRDSYDVFAAEFSASRADFWPELAYLAEHAVPNSRVLDIGCGNGRFYPLLAERNVDYTGIDNSVGLLAIAHEQHPFVTFMHGDATKLPFPDRSFDTVFSFAVLHHIPSRELRREFVREAARVLRPNGTLVLSVWNLWSPKHILLLIKGC